jgi:hypothetical protein
MKKLVLAALLLAYTAINTGCAGCSNNLKHMKSDFVGLKRTITVYSADGTVIKEWKTQAKVEDQGGTCYFLDEDGKAIIISGTFIIEEK